MCDPCTTVLNTIMEKIVDKVFESVWSELGYVFHYKKHMKSLEDVTNKLEKQRRTIEEQIEEAKTSGDDIVEDVTIWLEEAERLRQEVEIFKDSNTENVQCFKCIPRYNLGKEAKKKMDEVNSHATEANFPEIARPGRRPQELQFPSSEEYVKFDSRTTVFNGIVEALTDSKVNVIGVYGPGGVGKTTMVEKVGEQLKIRGLFDEVVMAVVSQEVKVFEIQGRLADGLTLKLEGETEVGRRDRLYNRLNNGKQNLVILDDIWEKLDFKSIGIPVMEGNKGCKVVLTSRNQRVLKDMKVCKDFEVQVLSEQEAWNLFKEKMENNVDSHDPLHDVAYAVCGECKGLPVAVVAVAAALKDKNMHAWRSALDKLRKSMLNSIEDINPKLFTSLKLSYDYLNSTDEKSCFLLCCLFPEDAQVSVEELARHCMARRLLVQMPNTLIEARDTVYSLVSTLKTKGLLLDGKNDDFVKMHDVVRDVAIIITKEEGAFVVKHGVEEWPETNAYEKVSAISLSFQKTIRKLPDELVYPELHTLMLEYSKGESWCYRELWIEIPDMFFRCTEKLMVLELNGVNMSLLRSSLEKLTKLRMLCLKDCKLGTDITMLKCLKNKLEVLSLEGFDIKALPHEVGELTRLRLLDLRNCFKLEMIPNGVISKLLWLEELYFPYGFENWEAATGNEERSKVSLDELTSLTRLSTLYIGVRYLRQFPVDLFFRNLIRFHILVGYKPLDESGAGCSRHGVMTSCDMWSDDDWKIWERLLGKPKWFNNLTQLEIFNCGSSKYLFTPSSARELQQLQRLKICGCEMLESVIRNEGGTEEEIIENAINFSQLKILSLIDLPCLISFYPGIKKATTGSQSLPPDQCLFNEKVAFPTLETLEILSLGKITGIWDMQIFSIPEKASNSSFSNLRAMEVGDCSNLENVVKGFSNMEVRGTKEIQESQVASYILQFPQLRSLKLYKLGILSSFSDASLITQARPLFNGQVAFPTLETLEIRSLGKITGIWDMQIFSIPEKASNSSFSNLRAMEVGDCSNLENVVKGFSNMEVRGTKEIQESQVASYILQFPQLRSLGLYNLGMLSSFSDAPLITQTRPLFNGQVVFPVLEKLTIVSMPNMMEIWDKNVHPAKSFGLLRSLKVCDCGKLMNVIPSHMLPLLHNIESLTIEKFPEMEVIVVMEKRDEETQEATNTAIIRFPKLTKLKLGELENLKDIFAYSSEGQLYFNKQVTFTADSSSTQSGIKDTSIITKTQPLFNQKVAFPALEELTIDSMPNITEIWDRNVLPAQSFCLLRSLEVYDCGKLINVIPSHMLPVLQNIGSLTIKKVSEMEVIVVLEKRYEETQVATNMAIIQFPKLMTLELRELKNLKGVCAYKSEGQLNFNVQSTLPALEYLDIESLPMITTIWSMQVPENIAESSFSQSRINDISLITETRPLFNLQGCETLINVVPSPMLPVILNLQYLSVRRCSKMEVIIVLERREEEAEGATNKDIIEFPELHTLILNQLEKLKGICANKFGDQLYFDVQVVFQELKNYNLYLDVHSQKIFKEAISGNKEMMDRFASRYPEMVRDDSEEEDVSEDEDEETHEKEKGGAVIRTPIPDKDDSQDEFKDEDEETPKKTGPSQKSLTKAAIKSLGPDEDDLEDEDNSWDEDEETSKKADPSERKPMEFATKTPILGEDDKKDEDEETPKKAKAGSTRKG